LKEYKIAAAAAGQRLDRFLAKILPKADTAFLHRMLRKKNITRNDKKAEGSERVEAGDVIRLWFSEETFRKFAGTQPDYACNLFDCLELHCVLSTILSDIAWKIRLLPQSEAERPRTP